VQIRQIKLDPGAVQTNMVFAAIAPEHVQALTAHLKNAGILILPNSNLRLVTHLDVSAAQVPQIVSAFRDYFANH